MKAILSGNGNAYDNPQDDAATNICPKSIKLRDTKIDLRGGHLTMNTGGSRQQKSGGGVDGRTMTTDVDDDGCVTGWTGGR